MQGAQHHYPAASRKPMIQDIPPMDRLLRPAVSVLIGNGAAAAEQDIGACLEEIFPEKHWRLILHEARTSHEIFSTVRNERIHLAFLFLKSIEYSPLRRAVVGPVSALGMIRILRSAWNVPIIAIDDSFVEPDRGEEALRWGADCVLRWPFEVRQIKDRLDAMTSVFYSHSPLDASGLPEHVKNQLLNWDGLGAVAFESFKKYGRVVIGIERDEAVPGGAKLSAITCNPFGGWPDPKILQMVLSYDPECEILIRFTDAGGRTRAERLRTGPRGNIPKKAHKIGLLCDYLRYVKVERVMAPFG
jgi:hypothetical protein